MPSPTKRPTTRRLTRATFEDSEEDSIPTKPRSKITKPITLQEQTPASDADISSGAESPLRRRANPTRSAKRKRDLEHCKPNKRVKKYTGPSSQTPSGSKRPRKPKRNSRAQQA
ncbi:MAG: hypothetical protein Q9195_005075 [Heterodermia aff. obscurata]